MISQETADMGKPEEAVAWALRLMPTIAGVGAVTNPATLAEWSKHLYACGFRHVSAIAALANPDGYIHVDQLPKQQIRLSESFRGPRNALNNAARWVPMNAPDPAPVIIPDIRDFTAAEKNAIRMQFPTETRTDWYAPDVASVTNE